MKESKLKENATKDERLKLNQLAREQLKFRILNDIRFDIEVCKLEGWDYKNYLIELKTLIDEFLK